MCQKKLMRQSKATYCFFVKLSVLSVLVVIKKSNTEYTNVGEAYSTGNIVAGWLDICV